MKIIEDQPSLLLLEFLSNLLFDSKIMILGTYRDIEVSREHPLSSTLAQLARTESYHREELGGLEGEYVAQLSRTSAAPRPPKNWSRPSMVTQKAIPSS